ncbi:MAG: UBP-type zinc finger domain-containing protein [Bacteroidota bacterium]
MPDLDPSFCQHLQAVKEVKLSHDHVCEECVKQGTEWFHLRTCQTCGVTLCCDQSDQQHMTKHYHAQHHPVVASAQPGERWLWCYPDEQFAEY